MSATLTQIHIELTNRCNLNCIMCYRQEMMAPKGEMDFSLFEKIVDQITHIHSIEKVFLHWRGEPTCCSYIVEAVKLLCKKGIKVILFTNGILFNKTIAKQLLLTGIQAIFFSLEAINPEEYARIRGTKQYNLLLENISNTIELRNTLKAKTRINISTIIFDNNVSKIAAFESYWKSIVDNIEYHVDTRGSSFMGGTEKQCQWPFRGLFIAWSGIVSACCMDVNIAYPLGDVNREKIIDIFNNEVVRKLRENLEKGLPIGRCNVCNFFVRQ